MFLPIGDTPNPRNYTPWVNWALIAANIAIYFFVSFPLSAEGPTAYDVFILEHGYKPGAPDLTDLLSSMFLHANFLHLAGNMLFLWIYGDNCEHRLGRILYLVVYLLTGAAATLTFSLFALGSMTPLIGASGAISGVLGMYFLLFKRNQVKVFVLLFPIFFNVVLLPARWVLGFYVVADNLLPIMLGAQSGVAYGAHLGGFVAGLAIAWIGDRVGWRIGADEPYQSRPTEPGIRQITAAELEDAITTGDRKTALRAFSKAGGAIASALNPYSCARLAEWLVEAGAPIAANDLLRRCIAQHRGASGPGVARMNLAMGLLRLATGQSEAAYQYLLAVFDHEPDPDTAMRAKQALSLINVYRRK